MTAPAATQPLYDDLAALFDCTPQDPRFLDFLGTHVLHKSAHSAATSAEQWLQSSSTTSPPPTVFPDCVYFAFPEQGLSFAFDACFGYKPQPGSAMPQLDLNRLRLGAVDVYHKPATTTTTGAEPKNEKKSKSQGSTKFDSCRWLPWTVQGLPLSAETTPKDMVEVWGEPSSKGGGSKSPVWLEWVCVASLTVVHLTSRVSWQLTVSLRSGRWV